MAQIIGIGAAEKIAIGLVDNPRRFLAFGPESSEKSILMRGRRGRLKETII